MRYKYIWVKGERTGVYNTGLVRSFSALFILFIAQHINPILSQVSHYRPWRCDLNPMSRTNARLADRLDRQRKIGISKQLNRAILMHFNKSRIYALCCHSHIAHIRNMSHYWVLFALVGQPFLMFRRILCILIFRITCSDLPVGSKIFKLAMI